MRDPELTVLLTVYHAIAPTHLRAALASIHTQTVQPADIIVVEDGPLPAALRAVLDSSPDLRRFALARNLGAASASQLGLEEVRTTWLARQDADDISLPTRFERQLDRARALDVDVLGAAMLEFDTDPDHPRAMRALPSDHDTIYRYARINNPVNNPSLLARTDAVHAVGGYRHVPYQEDYDLMIRLLGAGYRFYNVPEPLVKFRVTGEQFTRRRSLELTASERTIQRTLVAAGMVSRPRAVANYIVRSAYRRLPATAMNAAYRSALPSAGGTNATNIRRNTRQSLSARLRARVPLEAKHAVLFVINSPFDLDRAPLRYANPSRVSSAELVAAMDGARRFRTPLGVLTYALSCAPETGLAAEFGVYSGATLRRIAAQRPGAHGFDSFEGLPEDWRGSYRQGAFAVDRMPVVKDAVLHMGWFEDTLTPFLAEHPGAAAFLHLDADLYSSTATVLSAFEHRIGPGTVLAFDEYFNYPGWQEHEHRAFTEFIERTGHAFDYLAYNSRGQQVAVRIREP